MLVILEELYYRCVPLPLLLFLSHAFLFNRLLFYYITLPFLLVLLIITLILLSFVPDTAVFLPLLLSRRPVVVVMVNIMLSTWRPRGLCAPPRDLPLADMAGRE